MGKFFPNVFIPEIEIDIYSIKCASDFAMADSSSSDDWFRAPRALRSLPKYRDGIIVHNVCARFAGQCVGFADLWYIRHSSFV